MLFLIVVIQNSHIFHVTFLLKPYTRIAAFILSNIFVTIFRKLQNNTKSDYFFLRMKNEWYTERKKTASADDCDTYRSHYFSEDYTRTSLNLLDQQIKLFFLSVFSPIFRTIRAHHLYSYQKKKKICLREWFFVVVVYQWIFSYLCKEEPFMWYATEQQQKKKNN